MNISNWPLKLRIAAGAMLFIVIAVVVAVVFSKPAKSIWTEAVQGEFVIEMTESGDIEAITSMSIKAPSDWRSTYQILEMAPEGSQVKKGEVLVRFDTNRMEEELATAYETYETELANAVNLEKTQAQQKATLEKSLAHAEFAVESALIGMDMVQYETKSAQEEALIKYKKALLSLEEAKLNIETEKVKQERDLFNRRISIESARNNITSLEERIASFTIRAPTSGIVVYEWVQRQINRLKLKAGDTAQPGESIILLPDLSAMQLTIPVNEIDIFKIKVGQTATVRLDAFEDAVFTGTVISKAPMVSEKVVDMYATFIAAWTGARQVTPPAIAKFKVSILLDRSDPSLLPNMTGRANIILEDFPAVYIPICCVFENAQGETIVFPRDGYPVPRGVITGKRNDRFITIDEGLKRGEQISNVPPQDVLAYPLGRYAEMNIRKREKEELLHHIKSMLVSEKEQPVVQ